MKPGSVASKTSLATSAGWLAIVTMAMSLALPGWFGEPLWAQASSAPENKLRTVEAGFGRYYRAVPVRARPQVPAWKLPLDLGRVCNLDSAAKALRLDQADPVLKANGFVVMPGTRADNGM